MSNDDIHLKKYLQEINKYPVFEREKEQELARRIQDGDEDALQTLVKANLRFVVLISRKYMGSGLMLSDLINEGTIGLIEAAKRFNPDRGVKFITYAVWWIRQAILYAIANKSGIVRLPPKQANMLHMINKKTRELTQEYSRQPTPDEVASELDIPESELETLLRVARASVSVGPAQDADDDDIRNVDIRDDRADIAEQQAIQDAFVDDVDILLTCLDDREKEILELHYGFKGESSTLQEIGNKFGLTRERIRQIEKRAINKLRKMALKKNLQDYLE